MARHLLIGDGTAVAYTNGLLADGAVDIQKLSSDGPSSLVAGDTIADSDQIRIVQGGPSGIDVNIVSPWIYGRDIVAWGGQSGVAQTAEVMRITLSTNASAAGTHSFKIINLTNGAEPFEIKNYEYTVANGATPAAQCASLKAAIDADLPYWVNGAVTDNADGTLDITGFKKGEVRVDGQVQDELVHMDAAFDNAEGGATTMAVTYQTAGSRGFGDGFYVKELEEELRGAQYGFYNRVELPNTPAQSAVTSTAYDMYHLVATKDGSSHSQIHGVDNLIEIYIALPAGDADNVAFEAAANSYAASVNFAPVNL